MLVSPAEPLLLRRIGKVSSIPERYGADFFWCSGGKKHAVQRKTPADFVASVVDGRLHRELLQLRQVDGIRALVVEGPWIWAETGVWMGASRWDRLSYRQSIFTLMAEGVWIVSSESISDTIEVISELERWSQKPRHSFGRARANAVGQWGSPTSREYAIHLLQGLSGVGPELAERIFERFGIPWRWTVTAADLMQVEGIGRVKAEAMIDRLPPPDPPAEPVTPDPSLLIDRAQVKKPRRRKTPEEKKCAS